MMRVRDIRKALAMYDGDCEVVVIDSGDGSGAFYIKGAMDGYLFSSDDFEVVEDTIEEYEDDYDECGFDPYEGCYTYDCQAQRKRGN